MYFITVNLKGGLGNQLFQIFTVLNLAKKYNLRPIFPNVEKLDNGYRSTYYNLLFPNLILENEDTYNKNYIYISEKHFHYSPINILNTQQNYKLDGYFQSPKYFDSINFEEIKKYIQLKESDKNIIENKYRELIKNNKILVSIHVRKSDYINLQTIYRNLTLDYYKEAINIMFDRLIDKDTKKSDILFVIFSDNINWCRDNFRFIKTEFIEMKDYQELLLMSKCHHNIIANSTFSWWGAYLNDNDDKIIISPGEWFNNNLISKDILSENWIKI